MSNPLPFNGSLEMRDEAGRTVRYAVISADQLQELQEECERLRQQLAAQQRQVSEIIKENEKLRDQAQAVQTERDEYRASLLAVLREQAIAREAEIEAELLEAARTGVPAEHVLQELEELINSRRNGGTTLDESA
jgi:acyl transferase domain-containing protein